MSSPPQPIQHRGRSGISGEVGCDMRLNISGLGDPTSKGLWALGLRAQREREVGRGGRGEGLGVKPLWGQHPPLASPPRLGFRSYVQVVVDGSVVRSGLSWCWEERL